MSKATTLRDITPKKKLPGPLAKSHTSPGQASRETKPLPSVRFSTERAAIRNMASLMFLARRTLPVTDFRGILKKIRLLVFFLCWHWQGRLLCFVRFLPQQLESWFAVLLVGLWQKNIRLLCWLFWFGFNCIYLLVKIMFACKWNLLGNFLINNRCFKRI